MQRSIYDPGYVNAMSHFYRGEMGRIMVWRQRLDVTTNWAITSSTAIITIAFSTREVPHIIFFFNLAIVWVLLWIEARRYRFYDAFRARVRMLTARTEEADKVAGFAVGADDYLTKPFSLRELTVRVRAILRRVDRIASTPSSDPIELAGLSIEPSRRKVTLDGQEVQLTPLEFEILLAMARDPGVVFTREQLMDRVWGYRDYAGGRVVDSHVARIRRKLGEDGAEPRFVRTVHGVGYAFADE